MPFEGTGRRRPNCQRQSTASSGSWLVRTDALPDLRLSKKWPPLGGVRHLFRCPSWDSTPVFGGFARQEWKRFIGTNRISQPGFWTPELFRCDGLRNSGCEATNLRRVTYDGRNHPRCDGELAGREAQHFEPIGLSLCSARSRNHRYVARPGNHQVQFRVLQHRGRGRAVARMPVRSSPLEGSNRLGGVASLRNRRLIASQSVFRRRSRFIWCAR